MKNARANLGGPQASGTFVQRWLFQAPLAMVVVGLGFALSVFAWVGLRAVETSESQIAYERVLLEQSSELQSELQGYLDATDGLATTISATETVPSSSVIQTFFARFEPLNNRQSVNGLAVFEIIRTDADQRVLLEREVDYRTPGFASRYEGTSTGRPNIILTRLYGLDNSMSYLGRDLGGVPEIRQLVQSTTYSDRTAVGGSGLATAIFGNIDGSFVDENRPSVVIISPLSPSRNDDLDPAARELDGFLVGRLYLDQMVQDMRSNDTGQLVALELSSDGVPLASTMDPAFRGDPFGEPVVFTEGDATWAIQGYSAGLQVDHRGSWVALVTGLVLAITGGLFSTSARRHAITLGRLERSEFDARHDLLTGLLNRAGLTEELEQRLNDRRRTDMVAVLFLDLDRLKVINDSMGHSAGDEVLVHTARRLEAILRGDDIVCRFGGDEFVVVASDQKDETGAIRLADRVLEAFREPAVLDDESTQMISASIGISFGRPGESDAEGLLRDADLAMYRAKEAGGSRFDIFDSELRAQAVARLEVERELRRAIRTGQLVVHYQPIVDVETGMVDRLEALVRWQHPERGMVPPGQFLSVAAESGLIVDVGEHVLREACRQVATWEAAVGREIMVSVNVAERQLLDSGLIDTVRRVLAETGVKPAQLELEITEELIVEKLDNRLTTLRELDDMGIKLAIDDFGTSRASLSQLKSLDMVSTLKIDRAFVIDVANDSVDRKIITAIVALADSVGMEVVAEGVEYSSQVVALKKLGVDFIQGFYFQRPAPTEKVVGLLRKPFDIPVDTTEDPSVEESAAKNQAVTTGEVSA